MKVVLFHIDALQPAYIGAYGNDWIETPALDALAARGVVFDQYFAERPSPKLSSSLKAHPLQRVGLEVIRLDSLVPPWKLTAKDLAAYFANDAEDDEEPLKPWLDPLPSRIEGDDDATFERLQRTYAAAVTKLNAKIGRLLKKHADAVCIVTGGCGLPLGEHGTVGFSDSLHEEHVHLAVLMAWPDNHHAGRRVSALTQPIDLAPTICELLDISFETEGDPQQNGRSLLPLVESPFAALRNHIVLTNGQQVGVRTPEWYYLRQSAGDEGKLFVKPDDRWEVNDVASQHLDVVEWLRSLIPEAK